MSMFVRMALMPMAAMAGVGADAEAQVLRVYIGTYADGIYLMTFDPETGRLESRGRACETEAPSFLALHPSAPLLYSVGETGRPEGTVSAWRIDEATGRLALISVQSSRGTAPCHIAVAPSEKHVAVANYGTGSVTLLPIRADGGLDAPCAVVQHEGTGPNAARQEGPHAHSVYFDSSGERLLAADLGADKVFLYRYDADAGTLAPHAQPFASAPPGAGPRHLAFHPSGELLYALNELDSTITTYARDPQSGSLERKAVTPTLPDDFDGGSTTAEIRVHPSGRFLYASNRGHDSIAVFAIGADGLPVSAGWTPTGGQTPRNFNLTPDGRYLLAANQESDTVVVFRVDPETGALEPSGDVASAPRPVCVLFVNADEAADLR